MSSNDTTPGGGRVCPAQRAGLFTSPLRRLLHNPSLLFRGLVRDGDTALDFGCGPGFFTVPLARMVGGSGRVIAVDLQAAMLEKMRVRAERAGMSARVHPVQCTATTLGCSDPVDFFLAFYVAHELPDVARFMAEVHALCKPGARLFLAEPWFRVTAGAYRRTVDMAVAAGFRVTSAPGLWWSRATLFTRD